MISVSVTDFSESFRLTLLRLLSIKNPLRRDWMLKRALGLPPEVFGRAAKLLANPASDTAAASPIP
jgi:hypothetical protein